MVKLSYVTPLIWKAYTQYEYIRLDTPQYIDALVKLGYPSDTEVVSVTNLPGQQIQRILKTLWNVNPYGFTPIKKEAK